MIISILLAIVPFIPVFLQIAGFFIGRFGASEENLKAYQDMVEKNKDSGHTSVETYEKLDQYDKEMDEDLAKKNAAPPGSVPGK